ncbi:hypothetical protein E3P96_00468 [Wallemia ichthyophaga]|nr:hypothetical protein E3P96_00468 [Wallemia ichthyophaga]
MVKSSKPAKDTKNRSKLSDQVKASIKTNEYSKSHQKRMKKKAKQQLNVNLNDLDEGLHDIDQHTQPTHEESAAANSAQDKQQQQRKKLEEAANKTSNKPLTQKQKQKALQLETKRLPLILNHPQYSKDPFGTLKQHAENMLNQRVNIPNKDKNQPRLPPTKMTTVDELKNYKKTELVTKARELNLLFKSTDKKAKIFNLIVDHLDAVARDGKHEGSQPGDDEGANADASKSPPHYQTDGKREVDDAKERDASKSMREIKYTEPDEQSLTPLPDAFEADNNRGREASTRTTPILASSTPRKVTRGRPRKHKSSGEEWRVTKEPSAPRPTIRRVRSVSVSHVHRNTTSLPFSKGTPQRRDNIRSSSSGYKTPAIRKSPRSSHNVRDSFDEADLTKPKSTLFSTESDHEANQELNHDPNHKPSSEPEAVRDASVEQLQDDDDEAGSEPVAASHMNPESAEDVEVYEAGEKDSNTDSESGSDSDSDSDSDSNNQGRNHSHNDDEVTETNQQTELPFSQRQQEIGIENELPRLNDPYPNFRAQRLRISLPDESPVPLSMSKPLSRKITSSTISNKIETELMREMQKDLNISKFNHATLKQALSDTNEERNRAVSYLQLQIDESNKKTEARDSEIHELKVEVNQMKESVGSMYDEMKPLKEMIESMSRQLLQQAQSSQPTQLPQTSHAQPPSSPASTIAANIPLLSRASINQPTPRNKTIERVQQHTQKQELANPSPAPRTLGKHPRPRDSTDSDIVETIRDSGHHMYDEAEDAQPPKKRFRAGSNSWGGALGFGGRRESNGEAPAPLPAHTFAMPIFGPQFNDAAPRTQSESAGDDANEMGEEGEADEQSGGRKDISAHSKDTTIGKDAPPPTPPATKTRYGTERDYDNRFAD